MKIPYILVPMFTQLSPRYKALLFACLGYGAFVVSDAAVKHLTQFYSVYQIIALDLAMACVLFLVLSPWLGGVRSLYDPAHLWVHVVRGVGNFFGAILVVYFFAILPLTSVYTVMFLSPFIMTLIAIPLYGERVGAHRWLAMALGFIGVLVAFRPWENAMPLWQFGMLIAAPLAFSVMHSMMRMMKRPSDIAMGMYPMLLAAPPMYAMIFVMGDYVPVAPLHWLYLGVSAVCITVGFVTVSKAYHMADASLVSPVQYTQMIWGVLVGFFIFGDVPDGWMMGGSALIIASGLYLIHREKNAHADSLLT